MFSPLYRAFDDWNDWVSRIDNGDIVNYINRELRPRDIYLSDSDIRQALGELKDAASSEDYEFGGVGEDWMVNMMKKKLTRDLESNGSQDLHRSRSRFLIFSYVARRISSNELARALLRFFGKEGNRVVEEEKSFLLIEWCLGLQQLEGLVPQDKLSKAFRQVASLGPPMFEEWRRPGPHHSWITDLLRFLHESILHDHGRGRNQLQLITPRDLPVRRLSVPAFRRPSMIEMPPYPRTGYNSPMISPGLEMNALHLQQQVQAFELDRLRRDVDNMRYRR